MEETLVKDEYPKQLAFDEDLFEMTKRMHSGHFSFLPRLLTGVFVYRRSQGLVSFSENTTSPPEIRLYGR